MMYSLHAKLKFMFLGGLLTLIGLMFSNMSNNIEAQSGTQMIDNLTVRKLIVTESITITDGGQKPLVLISSDEDSGKVTVYDRIGAGAANLAVDKNGGSVTTVSATNAAGVTLSFGEHGGSVIVYDRTGAGAANFGVDKNGGRLAVFSRTGAGGTILSTNGNSGNIGVLDQEGVPRAAFIIVNGDGVISLISRLGKLRVLEP